jgi:agmatine deiminase
MYTKLLTLLALCATLATNAQTFTSPPPFSVRTMAEWEELQALAITWNPGTSANADSFRNNLTEITRAAQKECSVMVVCSTTAQVTSARNYMMSKGVDTTLNLNFVIAPHNTIWIRDYGPTSVYANEVDSLLLIDWIYNRVRPNDNAMSEKIGADLGLPVFATTVAPYDLVNTGGNFMSDGLTTAFASKLIFRNNDQIPNGETGGNDVFGTSDHTEASIDNIFQEYMGIERYIKMEELPFDGIHHIDMHMKLLDEETLLVGEFPTGVSDGPQLEANLQYVLSQYKTAFGRDFKVVRLPIPPFLNGQYAPFNGNPNAAALYPTYINAVFVNKTIIIPKFNIPEDQAAQDTFQKYLPGYTVAPVHCTDLVYRGGAVHCITKEIGVQDPLLIVHKTLDCQDNSIHSSYEVTARLKHRSGIDHARVYYTTDPQGMWQSVDMQAFTGDTMFNWKAAIPQFPDGSTVYYYIEATAANGKTLTRPLPAPKGWWSFCVTQSSGIPDVSIPEMGLVFPNPASAITAIPVHSKQAVAAKIQLVNLLGQSVATLFEGTLPAGKSHHFFDARQFTPGVYLVELQAGSSRFTQKVVIR